MNTHNEIWIGLIGLYPSHLNEVVGQNQGAYANVLLIACNVDDYKAKAKEFLCTMDFDIFEIEDIEPLNERMQNFEVDGSIMDLAEIVKIRQTPQISTLHVFDRDSL
jgi:hypothetical protein